MIPAWCDFYFARLAASYTTRHRPLIFFPNPGTSGQGLMPAWCGVHFARMAAFYMILINCFVCFYIP